jgi:hypothetical protein
MHMTSRVTTSLQADRSARALLGEHHPLARAMHRTSVAVERSCVVCGTACVSVGALLEGAHGALAYLLASAVVLAVLSCELAFLASRRTACAREVIIEGLVDVPLAVVQRERDRLVDRAHWAELANHVEAMREEGRRPGGRLPMGHPVFSRRVIAAVDPELEVLARRLRTESVSVRGIAMAERLLTDGCSPLYGTSVGELREELHRIMFSLGD